MRSRDVDVRSQADRPAIGGNSLDVHQRRGRSEGHRSWINDGESSIRREPNSSDRIRNERFLALHALCAVEAVCQTIFPSVRFTDRVARNRVAIDSYHVIRSRYPERAGFVFLDSKHLFMQRL